MLFGLGVYPGHQRVKQLEHLKSIFESLEKLETLLSPVESRISSEVAKFLSEQEWPQQQWCRENFSYLTESNFKDVPSWLQSELMAYGQSHNCTLMLENLFNVTRRQARRSHTGTLDAKGMWHATAFGQCPAEFERPVVPVTAAAKSMSEKKLPNDIFTPDKELVSFDKAAQARQDNITSGNSGSPGPGFVCLRLPGFQVIVTCIVRTMVKCMEG